MLRERRVAAAASDDVLRADAFDAALVEGNPFGPETEGLVWAPLLLEDEEASDEGGGGAGSGSGSGGSGRRRQSASVRSVDVIRDSLMGDGRAPPAGGEAAAAAAGGGEAPRGAANAGARLLQELPRGALERALGEGGALSVAGLAVNLHLVGAGIITCGEGGPALHERVHATR